jgi:hypothetical protein
MQPAIADTSDGVKRRSRQPRKLYDPTPISSNAYNALLSERGGRPCVPSELSTEEVIEAAARRKAAAKKRREEEAAAALAAEQAALALEEATPRPLSFTLPFTPPAPPSLPAPTHAAKDGAAGGVAGFGPALRARRRAVCEGCDAQLEGVLEGSTIGVVSEFTGIGALEHGLHAGFAEVGSRVPSDRSLPTSPYTSPCTPRCIGGQLEDEAGKLLDRGGGFEPLEWLLGTLNGTEVLHDYLRTPRGAPLQKCAPALAR